MSAIRDLSDFAKHAFKAEFMTPAGIINVIWQACVLAVVVVIGLADVWQAIVRSIGNEHYTTGLPSIIVVLLTWGGIMLACVLIVALVTPRTRS